MYQGFFFYLFAFFFFNTEAIRMIYFDRSITKILSHHFSIIRYLYVNKKKKHRFNKNEKASIISFHSLLFERLMDISVSIKTKTYNSREIQ